MTGIVIVGLTGLTFLGGLFWLGLFAAKGLSERDRRTMFVRFGDGMTIRVEVKTDLEVRVLWRRELARLLSAYCQVLVERGHGWPEWLLDVTVEIRDHHPGDPGGAWLGHHGRAAFWVGITETARFPAATILHEAEHARDQFEGGRHWVDLGGVNEDPAIHHMDPTETAAIIAATIERTKAWQTA